jgi:hypothetical protein
MVMESVPNIWTNEICKRNTARTCTWRSDRIVMMMHSACIYACVISWEKETISDKTRKGDIHTVVQDYRQLQLQAKPRTGGRQVHGRCCALPGLMISQLHPGCFFAWPLTQQKDGRLTHRCLFVPGMFLPPKQSRASVPAIMISRKRTGGTATC